MAVFLTAVSTRRTSKTVGKTFLLVLVSFENDCGTQEAASHGQGVSLFLLVVVILLEFFVNEVSSGNVT